MTPREYKRPVSVLVVVYTLQGDVLLLRRAHPPWFWQSVTGSLEPGETPRAAAERELREETGIIAGNRLVDCRHSERFPIIPPWRASYAPNVHSNQEHWFRVMLTGRRTVQINLREHRSYRWLPLQQAACRATSRTNRAAIQRLGR